MILKKWKNCINNTLFGEDQNTQQLFKDNLNSESDKFQRRLASNKKKTSPSTHDLNSMIKQMQLEDDNSHNV